MVARVQPDGPAPMMMKSQEDFEEVVMVVVLVFLLPVSDMWEAVVFACVFQSRVRVRFIWTWRGKNMLRLVSQNTNCSNKIGHPVKAAHIGRRCFAHRGSSKAYTQSWKADIIWALKRGRRHIGQDAAECAALGHWSLACIE